jgi:hypothetical protein
MLESFGPLPLPDLESSGTLGDFMEPDEIRRVEQKNPILQVAIELGLKVRGNMSACLRGERHPEPQSATLFFDVARNSFLCKSCSDVGGGVIDLVCQVRGWERQQAIEWLAHRIAFDQQTRDLYYNNRGRRKR